MCPGVYVSRFFLCADRLLCGLLQRVCSTRGNRLRNVWFGRFLREGNEEQLEGNLFTILFGQFQFIFCQARHVELPGVEPYNTKASLPQRFIGLDFTAANALTLYEIRRQHYSDESLKRFVLDLRSVGYVLNMRIRMSELEMLDEVEELDLVLAHYAITWGIKVPKCEKYQSPSEELSPWLNWGLHGIGSSKPIDSTC